MSVRYHGFCLKNARRDLVGEVKGPTKGYLDNDNSLLMGMAMTL